MGTAARFQEYSRTQHPPAHLDVPTLHERLFDEDGNTVNAGSRKFLQEWVDRYVAWAKAHGA